MDSVFDEIAASRPDSCASETRQLRAIKNVAESDGYSAQLVYTAIYLGMRCAQHHLDGDVIDLAERWVQTADGEDKFAAHDMLGFYFWLAGRNTEAVGSAERAVEEVQMALLVVDVEGKPSEVQRLQLRLSQSRVNLAHYLADLGGGDKRGVRRERSLALVKEALEDGELRPEELDTVGYVKIVFGDREEIAEGQQLRAAAKEKTRPDSSDRKVMELGDDICERIASQRKQDLNAPRGEPPLVRCMRKKGERVLYPPLDDG